MQAGDELAGVGLTTLRPYPLQVGGHSTDGDAPASLTDGSGRFLKLLQDGERGAREAAFYTCMEAARGGGGGGGGTETEAAAAGGRGGSTGAAEALAAVTEDRRAGGAVCGEEAALLAALARFVPRYYGTVRVAHQGGRPYLALEDLAAPYTQPCLLDAKVGLRTWYPWAAPALQDKWRSKDESTTQSTLGFRLCGARVYNAACGAEWRVDRHWGKTLTPETVGAALARFADNGALQPGDVYGGERGVLAQLAQLEALFERQTSWHLYSASVLVSYEGSARSAADAHVRVALVDFAHAFRTGGGGEAPAPRPDANFVAGLRGLRAAMTGAASMRQRGGGGGGAHE